MNARSYALRLLKNRLRSAWEIDQALLRKGVEEPERQEVIEELTRVDLINDQRYATAYVHTRDRLAPRGEYVLRMELAKHGISKELISAALATRREEAVDEDAEQPTELELATQLIQGKERAYAHLDPETRKRRLTSLLMRRGFSYDIARRILDA